MLCDTNILIYAADPADMHCIRFVERDDACIASVSRIEVLGFPGWGKLTDDRRIRLREIVASMVELALNETVIHHAIVLGQQRKISLGDAVIAATALAENIPLATRNVEDFRHIVGLKLINSFDAI